ncbi:MAG: sulfatase [Deltaproteobacteria bacterium]|nr:sulfatase [Deltaproteobacteria bacterium]
MKDQLQRIRRGGTATLMFGCIGLASAAGAGGAAMLLAAPYGDWVYPGFGQHIGLVAVLASIGALVGLAGGLLLWAGIRLLAARGDWSCSPSPQPLLVIAFAAALLLAVGLRLIDAAEPGAGAALSGAPPMVPVETADHAEIPWRSERSINVVLISLDTLRADHLGIYAHAHETSPNIDDFFASGAVFTNAYASSPWTLPSHASMMSGQHSSTNGSRIHPLTTPRFYIDPISEATVTLAEVFRAAGYRTAGFTGGGYVSPEFGFDQGFDVYESTESTRMKEALDRALPWLSADRDEPFFLFLHAYDVHRYDPPELLGETPAREYDGPLKWLRERDALAIERGANQHDLGELEEADLAYLRLLYDSEILNVDRQLSRLFSMLEDSDLLDRTVVLLTSDHGEAFGEHAGAIGHAESFYEGVMRVPLLIRAPGQPTAVRPRDLVQIVDIAPSLLELAGIAIPGGMQGISLVPALLGSELPKRPAILEADDRDTQAAVVVDGFKYIDPAVVSHDPLDPRFWKLAARGLVWRSGRLPELYDLRPDPGEQRNLAKLEPDRARVYSELLRSEVRRLRVADPGGIREAPGELVDQLRALGYVE